MENSQRYSCAVVTGASSGLGEEFALQLAPRVGRLVLVARRGEMLEDLAQRIGQKFSCEVVVMVADLACGDQRAALIADLRAFPPRWLEKSAKNKGFHESKAEITLAASQFGKGEEHG